MRIRPYREEDAAATLEIYERAIHHTGAASYSQEQLAAWAPLNRDADGRTEWGRRRAVAETVVAVEENQVAGFSDLVDGTLLDMLFVDPSFGRRGVGSLLIQSSLSRGQPVRHMSRPTQVLSLAPSSRGTASW